MRITRIIAGTLIITTAGLISGLSEARAQDGSGATPPAEYPPTSYTGKQYVDSRGCIYVRADVDGAVTWVPRVSRDRNQICGYKPTAVAGATKTPPAATEMPVVTAESDEEEPARTATAEPSEQPADTAAASSQQPAAASAASQPEQDAVVEAIPEETMSPEAAQEAVADSTPEPPAPQTAAKSPEHRQQPTAVTATSKPVKTASKPRTKPASAAARTVTVVPLAGGKAQPEIQLAQKTRVVPRHVYENRTHVRSVKIPRGYRPVWDDDRLNLHRAERTLAPANLAGAVTIPRGYQIVDRADDRFNSRRGPRTEEGNAQSMLVWTNEVPMRLIRVPTNSPVIRVDEKMAASGAEAQYQGTFRVSTQSAPKSKVMYDR